jgi:hypothetical protein
VTVDRLVTEFTFKFVKVPTVVIFVWVLESWRAVRTPVRFEEFMFEIPEPFPEYN